MKKVLFFISLFVLNSTPKGYTPSNENNIFINHLINNTPFQANVYTKTNNILHRYHLSRHTPICLGKKEPESETHMVVRLHRGENSEDYTFYTGMTREEYEDDEGYERDRLRGAVFLKPPDRDDFSIINTIDPNATASGSLTINSTLYIDSTEEAETLEELFNEPAIFTPDI